MENAREVAQSDLCVLQGVERAPQPRLRLPGLPAQLHGLAPAGTLGAPLICIGIAVDEGVGRSAGKALITALVLLVTGPVAATVTSRTALISDDPPPDFVLPQDERTAP